MRMGEIFDTAKRKDAGIVLVMSKRKDRLPLMEFLKQRGFNLAPEKFKVEPFEEDALKAVQSKEFTKHLVIISDEPDYASVEEAWNKLAPATRPVFLKVPAGALTGKFKYDIKAGH